MLRLTKKSFHPDLDILMDDECAAVCELEVGELESRSGSILDSVEESGGRRKQKEDSFRLQKLCDRFR